MSRNDPADVLTDLIRRTPVHVVDLEVAHRTGDHVAIAYAKAMARWQAESREVLAEEHQASQAPGRHGAPDAFARAAAASEMMRPHAAE